MRIDEILEHSNFGITGTRKDVVTHFFATVAKDTLVDMGVGGKDRRAVTSLAKRISGSVIPNLFHVRNAIKGKDKHFERRIRKLMSPYILGAIKSVTTDHPSTTKAFTTDEFHDRLLQTLVGQKDRMEEVFFV